MDRGPASIGLAAVLILVIAGGVSVARDPASNVVVAGPSETATPSDGVSGSPSQSSQPTTPSPSSTASDPGAPSPPEVQPTATSAATAPPAQPEDPTPTPQPTPTPTPDPVATSEPPPPPEPTPTPTPTPPAGYEPAPVGTYQYDTDGTTRLNNDSPERLPEVTTMEAGEPSDRQQQRRRDLRRDDGEGSVTTLHLSLRDDGAFLHRVDIATTVNFLGGFTDRRSFQASEPVRIADPGAGPGDVQTFTLTGDGTTLHGTVTILREETVSVGGQQVDAVVVEQVFDLSGDVDGRSTTIAWMRPADLLTLREEVTTDVSAMGQRSRADYTAVLQSLQ